MEAAEESEGPQIDESEQTPIVTGVSSKTTNRLKIAENGDDSVKMTNEGSKERKKMDPYKELELYLAKVNEEIGEIIESVPSTPLLGVIEKPKSSAYQPNKSSGSSGTAHTINRVSGTRSLPSKRNLLKRQNSKPFNTIGRDDSVDWSDSILAEFNTIIAKEINELNREKLNSVPRGDAPGEDRRIGYRELLNEFGICDSECSEESSCEQEVTADSSVTSSDRHSSENHLVPRETRANLAERLWENGEFRERGLEASQLLNSDYDEPRDRIASNAADNEGSSLPGSFLQKTREGKERRSVDVWSSDYDEPNNCLTSHGQGNRNSSSLPLDFQRGRRNVDSHTKYCGDNVNEEPKNSSLELGVVIIEKNVAGPNEAGSDISSSAHCERLEEEKTNAKLPPRYLEVHRKTSLPANLMSQKRSRKGANVKLQRIGRMPDNDVTDHDYDDVFARNGHDVITRSKSLENNTPTSAPVTPTEEKKPPFSKLLRKRHVPVFHENVGDAVLVRVSSLPDQDLLHLSNERLLGKMRQTRSPMDDQMRKKRAVSPLTLRSDVSAKRLSESDKDVRQISPVNLKVLDLMEGQGQ